MEFCARKTKEALIVWIRAWFEKNGRDCNAVIGISGGKDSSVCAALCVEALGRDRVIGVLMPNGTQSDIADSRQLVEYLGIRSVRSILPVPWLPSMRSSGRPESMRPPRRRSICLPGSGCPCCMQCPNP